MHAAVADAFVPRIADLLHEHGVELVGDDESRQRSAAHRAAAPTATSAASSSTSRCRSPSSHDLDAAIAHVNRYGTGHTEAILTRDLESARRFTDEVDAAAVIVNASTRFTDGEEFGFGAEIGISTQKLHARGPMGLRELTTYKYVVWGDGQIRG